jgi:hypothetical protein
VVAHAFNPSTWEAEAGGFLSSRPAWSTERVPGQPGLHRETLSRKTKKKKKKKKKNQPTKQKKTWGGVRGGDREEVPGDETMATDGRDNISGWTGPVSQGT